MRKSLSLVVMLWLLVGINMVYAWEIERPQDNMDFNSRVDSAGTDDEASVGLGVNIVRYADNDPWQPMGGRDGVYMQAIATANTRKAITYSQAVVPVFDWWCEATSLTGINGDDSGKWFDLEFPVRFYGGPGHPYSSGEYQRVWVSSNGFLSFDSTSNSSSPKPIPDSESPNSLLAVYWSDLVPWGGGAIKYYSDSSQFVVLWDNVLDKRNNIRQTFEVIIEYFKVPSEARGQNRITFLYESVTWSSVAVVGIEDQEGCKGTIPSPFPQSGQCVQFTSLQEAPEIKRIAIELQKDDIEASIIIDNSDSGLWGHNVKLRDETKDTDGIFEKAVKGYGSLLITTMIKYSLEKSYGVSIGPVGGLLISGVMVGIPLALEYARSLSPLNTDEAEIQHAYESDDFAYVNASAEKISPWGRPVDASLGIQFYWVFNDQGTVDHTLNISAELEYYSYETNTDKHLTVVNPVTLTFLHEAEPREVSIPCTIRGSVATYDLHDSYWYLLSGTNLVHKIKVTPLSPDVDLALDLYDYNPSTGAMTLIASSYGGGTGESESITEGPFASVSTYRLVKVTYWLGSVGDGWYDLQIYTEPPDGGGGGGGGCWPPPLMMAW